MGKKSEIYSLPCFSINMWWSIENAGGFLDTTAEVELWTSAGRIKVKLHEGVDIQKFDKLIVNAIL
ncbi:hypothetical protein D3C76_1226690 [compost metagenome]